MSNYPRTIGAFNVVSGSPAAQAAIRVLEKLDYLRQAERAADDAQLIVSQAAESLLKAIKEVREAEGYIPDTKGGYHP